MLINYLKRDLFQCLFSNRSYLFIFVGKEKLLETYMSTVVVRVTDNEFCILQLICHYLQTKLLM